jgi:hypothetical protein
MGADGITALSPKREMVPPHCPQMGRRMNPIRAGSEPMSITMCWIGLARKVSQNQTEPFLRRTCAGERGYHTWCEPCLLGLAMEAKILPKREPSVQHGGIVESARRAAAPRSPLPASEKVTRTSRYFRVGITFPTFCLTDRSTISDESPIDWTTVEPVDQFLLLYAVVGWLATLKEGGQRNL